jgi:DnaJ-class molecular chaperone
MKRYVKKAPHVTLCRECGGTGRIEGDTPVVCPQCEGSGRVTVSGVMELDIRAFKPKVQ